MTRTVPEYDGFNLADYVTSICGIAKEARAAGDTDLSQALVNYCKRLEHMPGGAVGRTVLELRDGRRVPVHTAAQHIRRSGKPAGVQTRGSRSPLVAEMERLSRECRKLASQADASRIAAVLNAPESKRRTRPANRTLNGWEQFEAEREIDNAVDGY